MIHVFTSAAVNYLPKVRLLCQSIRKFHPEFTIHLALADRVPDWFDVEGEPFDSVMPVETIDIPDRPSWIFRHSLVELSTGIKPFVLASLLARPDCDGVFYFDPDMVLYSRLDDLLEDLAGADIVLTPHQTLPETSHEAIIDNEIGSLNYGIFNLGFIGVRPTPEGKKFAAWWSDRLHSFCREALDQGLWTDQKWINFAPVFFDGVKILKSSRYNVAPWNITTRQLAGDLASGLTVDGNPLGFYHFTGFDSGAHKVMATKYAGDSKAVGQLVRWYEEEDRRGRDPVIDNTPWAFRCFNDGKLISVAHRAIYRMRKDLQEAYPDPFDNSGAAPSYDQWFQWRAHVEHPELTSPGDAPPARARAMLGRLVDTIKRKSGFRLARKGEPG